MTLLLRMPDSRTNGELKANEIDLLRQIKERGEVTSVELRAANAIFEGVRLNTFGYLSRSIIDQTNTKYTINEKGLAKLEETAQH